MAAFATNTHLSSCRQVCQKEQLAAICRHSSRVLRIHRDQLLPGQGIVTLGLRKQPPSQTAFQNQLRIAERTLKRGVQVLALHQDAETPTSVEIQPITSEEQFAKVLAEAQQRSEPVIFVWMAIWCRKCIYLKPKLEKLAAEFFPRVRFYCVDVNAVPQALVKHAEVAKMPTIQLWRNGKKQAEVIGGHNKAWLVVAEIREMIENY